MCGAFCSTEAGQEPGLPLGVIYEQGCGRTSWVVLIPSCGPACPPATTVRVEQVVGANCCSAVVTAWPLIPGSALWLIY